MSLHQLLKIAQSIELSVEERPRIKIQSITNLLDTLPSQFLLSNTVIKDPTLYNKEDIEKDLEAEDADYRFSYIIRIINGEALIGHVKKYLSAISDLFGQELAAEFSKTYLPKIYLKHLKEDSHFDYLTHHSKSLSSHAKGNIMSLHQLLKLANKFEKITKTAHDHEYDTDSFEEERELSDLDHALELFEQDYVIGASLEDLLRLRKQLKEQINEVVYEQEATAEHEGDYDFQPTVPVFLIKRLEMVDEAIVKIKYGK
jgi:hypothetical protein